MWHGWCAAAPCRRSGFNAIGDRLISAHVKDIAPSGTKLDEDGWADVGAGVLDWHSLWQTCRDCGARWMVVEHDKPSDPVRCARASFAWLSKLQG